MHEERAIFCHSVFANGELTSERYTRLWIDLIRQLENSKETVAVH